MPDKNLQASLLIVNATTRTVQVWKHTATSSNYPTEECDDIRVTHKILQCPGLGCQLVQSTRNENHIPQKVYHGSKYKIS